MQKMINGSLGIQEQSQCRRSEMHKGPNEVKPFCETEFYLKYWHILLFPLPALQPMILCL